MNKIDKDELFRHLSGFLKAKGVELQEGPYTQQVQKGCGILADTVNLSQQAFDRAKTEMERQLDHMRQIIHAIDGSEDDTASRTIKKRRSEIRWLQEVVVEIESRLGKTASQTLTRPIKAESSDWRPLRPQRFH